MPTGKPNFNLNSYGIKYLSKEEVQEFLNKYEIPTGADQAALATERGKKGTGEKLSETGRNLVSDVTPKSPEAKPRVTNNTEHIFNDPRYGIPDTRKPQTTGHGESGVVPPNTPALDTRISTGTAIGNKGDREGGVGNAPEELTGDDIRPSKQGNRTVSVGVGQKGKEVFDKKEGVGEKYEKQYDSKGKKISAKARKEKLQKETEAKEKREKQTKLNQALHKLEQEKQEKKKIPQKTGEGNKIETEPTIETESEESFKKRSRENERKRQADAAKKKKKKLTDNERMTNIVERYRAERGLGKSNDIITKMNILKLNLMGNKKDENKKDDVFSPRSADVGKRHGKKQGKNQVRTQIETTAPQILNTLSHNVLNNMKYRTDEDKKENKIKNAAAETIFKAISLKLDLMNKLDTSPKGMKGQKFVRGSMASAGRKPATKLPNAGGVQDKLEIMRDEAPEVTPEDTARHKKLAETGATGEKAGSVANRYS